MPFTFGADITARLADFRALSQSAMTDLCDVVEPTVPPPPPNPDGSPADDPGTVTAHNVPCRMTAKAQAQEILIALRLTDVGDHVLSVPVGTVVRVTDHIVYQGNRYEVVGSDADRTFATEVNVALKRII